MSDVALPSQVRYVSRMRLLPSVQDMSRTEMSWKPSKAMLAISPLRLIDEQT